jgi:hypothetical protein
MVGAVLLEEGQVPNIAHREHGRRNLARITRRSVTNDGTRDRLAAAEVRLPFL